MNEVEFLNLEVGNVIYRGESTTPCVVTSTKPHVTVVASACIMLEDCKLWERPSIARAPQAEPEPEPASTFKIVAKIVEVLPDGTENEVTSLQVLDKDILSQDEAQEVINDLAQA